MPQVSFEPLAPNISGNSKMLQKDCAEPDDNLLNLDGLQANLSKTQPVQNAEATKSAAGIGGPNLAMFQLEKMNFSQ